MGGGGFGLSARLVGAYVIRGAALAMRSLLDYAKLR
jgi:hypothetical protein